MYAWPQNVVRHKLEATITFGPCVGKRFPLLQGSNIVGRDQSCAAALKDPSLGRNHLEISVGADGSVQCKPLDACLLNGEAISTVSDLDVGDRIQFGRSELRIDEVAEIEEVKVAADAFVRAPHFPEHIDEVLFNSLGEVPKKPEVAKIAYFAILSPMVAAILMAVLLGQPRYILFGLLSPIIGLASYFDQKRRTKNRAGDDMATFRDKLEQTVIQVDVALAQERSKRLKAAPDLTQLISSAQQRDAGLWVRDRKNKDFLMLRIGLGAVDSHVSVAVTPGGPPELYEKIENLCAKAETLAAVPVTLQLSQLGVLCFTGDTASSFGLLNALLLQMCCLHSPADLLIVASLQTMHDFRWLYKMPHVVAAAGHVPQPLANTAADSSAMLGALASVLQDRMQAADNQKKTFWPHIVCVLDAQLFSDAIAAVSAHLEMLLSSGPRYGISIVWLAPDGAAVARQATAVLTVQKSSAEKVSHLCFTDSEKQEQWFLPEHVSLTMLGVACESLAPMRDGFSAEKAGLPKGNVSLSDVLGEEAFDPFFLAQCWEQQSGYDLPFTFGVNDSGPFTLDLVKDGPHCLIGGTSGAGKSELLLAFVAGLAKRYSPKRVAFLFLDYKGGSASEVFTDLPHQVGYATNLDSSHALRVVTSLKAELTYRMHLLQGKAKDMEELYRKRPDLCPPSLVVIVDEFATLAAEVPEFIAGVVDVAQRGRSLGIHLVLATQRPQGCVNENILANTTIRIALRTLSAAESSSILGSGEAAQIRSTTRGRAFVKREHGQLHEVQSAYASALTSVGKETQIEQFVAACVTAAKHLGLQPSRKPWCEPLPETLFHSQLAKKYADEDSSQSGLNVLIGLVDHPDMQTRKPAIVDLSAGPFAVFGAGGSGKTTALQTLAASASRREKPPLLYGIDFASRQLLELNVLPNCVAVATADAYEGVTRIIEVLSTIFDERRSAQAASVANHEHLHYDRGLLLLVDGFDILIEEFERSKQSHRLQQPLESLVRLVKEGRQVGIFCAFSVTTRSLLRSSILSCVHQSLVLKHNEVERYSDFGLTRKQTEGASLPPGRGFWNGSLAQVAVTQVDGEKLAEPDGASETAVPEKYRTQALPEKCSATLQPALVSSPQLGVADISMASISLDLENNSFAVVGPQSSGKSSTLLLLISQLFQKYEIDILCLESSPLRELADVCNVIVCDKGDVGNQLQALVGKQSTNGRLVVFDDVDLLAQYVSDDFFRKFLQSGLRYAATTATFRSFVPNALLQTMRSEKVLLYLQPQDAREILEATGNVVSLRVGVSMCPGRGVLLKNRQAQLLQVFAPAS